MQLKCILQTTVDSPNIVRMIIKEVITLIFCWTMANVKEARGQEFTNMWIAEIHGGEGVAQRVARELGYTYKGQAQLFDDHYVLTRDDHPDISPRGSHELTKTLLDVEEVKWAQQQSLLERSALANVPKYELKSITYDTDEEDSSKLGTFPTNPSAGKGTLDTYKGVTKNILLTSNKKLSAYIDQFTDPLWRDQWYSQDYRLKPYPVMDHNVVPVYKMGFTGKGVTVAVVDDGIQKGHPDLEGNYNYSLSWDFLNDKPGSDPDPPTPKEDNSHGTQCAGVVGMVANNGKCGVGVAYEATLAGMKMLGPKAVEYTEAQALNHNLPSVDIYSCSWGPEDNGIAMWQMGHLIDMALNKGVKEGRNGKGAIYLFAGGNGRQKHDNCAASAFVNHVHTIAVAAAGQNGKWSYYSEHCSAIFTTGYSGTLDNMDKVIATDLEGTCTKEFSGTSAATPMVAGMVALALQANPNLTYRDVMHLITMSSEVAPLADNGNYWYKNGRGFWVSNDFGFGLLNAENMVNLAKTWSNVPPVKSCIVSAVTSKDPIKFTGGKWIPITFDVDGCKGTDNEVRYLEQIQVTSSIEYLIRGAIAMTIKSPAGTETELLYPRMNDETYKGLDKWVIKTVHQWGESPEGKWQIDVGALRIPYVDFPRGRITEIEIAFYGTTEKPSHHKDLPRKYAAFRLPNGKTSED